MIKKIAVLGDFNPVYATHHALNDCIRQMVQHMSKEIQFDWISTDIFNYQTAFKEHYCGLWIAPGSPYRDMQNVLGTITYARENKIPTLGNCGGFQHMVIEFARNICGIKNAGHEETHPGAEDLVISKLACSLVAQQEELTLTSKDSLLFSILKKEKITGRYFCSYGINSRYIDILQSHGLAVTAVSPGGQVRAFEIPGHPFFTGTLFQPALTSTKSEPDKIILEFIKKSIEQ